MQMYFGCGSTKAIPISFRALLTPLAGKDARCDSVDQARHSITMVTSLWGSGEAGPLCLVLPLGYISGDKQAELAKQFAPDVYFVSSGRSTHFMNAECVVAFFETVLAPAFEHRRARLAERYQRSFQDEWGAILADSFTGHHSTASGFDIQRIFSPKNTFKFLHFVFLAKWKILEMNPSANKRP